MFNSLFDSELFAKTTGTYLDSAAYGLAPRASAHAVLTAVEAWGAGTARWYADWDPIAEGARASFASITGTAVRNVALVPAASIGTSLVVSGFGPGDEVIIAEDEFDSLLMPLYAGAAERGFTLRTVPYERLLDEITDRTSLVVTSHVRSNDGRAIDLDALQDAARRAQAAVMLDVTHSAGIKIIDVDDRGFDFVVCSAYKHLLSPRGAAFLTVAEPWWQRLTPRTASWRGQRNPYRINCGDDLTALNDHAARFDVSLDWFAWLGTSTSLELIETIPATERQDHCLGLARTLAASLDLPASGSSLLCVPYTGEKEQVRALFEHERVRVTVGDETVRVSFHLYNDLDDLDLVQGLLSRVHRR